ncbi:MAG: nucleotide pyrophosphohydrolase [Acholeplasmataceae bacterium]
MKELIETLKIFRQERGWEPYHKPENLAKSIVLEAAELLENFQWTSEATDTENVADEVADIMTYCLFMCEHYGFDPEEIILKKLKKTKEKYPIEKAYGKATKYDKL